jgi:hypothetical protein
MGLYVLKTMDALGESTRFQGRSPEGCPAVELSPRRGATTARYDAMRTVKLAGGYVDQRCTAARPLAHQERKPPARAQAC